MITQLPAVLSVPALIVAGVAASPHCGLMCGPLQAMQMRGRGAMPLPTALAWMQSGRLVGYAALGALAGMLGGRLLPLLPPEIAGQILRLVTAGALIFMGFSLVRNRHESCAMKVPPSGTVPGPIKPFLMGLAWALVPCGLLYALLFLAGASGSALSGALLMSAFAVGSAPLLLLVGVALSSRHDWQRGARLVSASCLILFGVLSGAVAIAGLGSSAAGWCASGESRPHL